MKAIIMNRREGKTTEIIKEAYRISAIVLVRDSKRKMEVERQSCIMKMPIQVYIFENMIRRCRGMGTNTKYLVDDMEDCVNSLLGFKLEGFSVSSSIENEQIINREQIMNLWFKRKKNISEEDSWAKIIRYKNVNKMQFYKFEDDPRWYNKYLLSIEFEWSENPN